MPLTPPERAALARDLLRVLRKARPGWSDAGNHDPGNTVLEVLAYVLDALLDDRTTLDDQARRLAARIAERLRRHAETPAAASDCAGGLRRVDYFAGMLLGIDDLRTEQDYLRQRLDRRNRLLPGAGVVSGLEVTLDDNGADCVVVGPGFAIDRRGREIAVEQPHRIDLPAKGSSLFVNLAYAERPCGPARIVETFGVSLDPAPSEDALPLARLRRVRGRWRMAPASRASQDRDAARGPLKQRG